MHDDWIVLGLDRRPVGTWDDTCVPMERMQCDLTRPGAIEAAAARASAIGRLLGWVNNAAIIENTPLHLMTDDHWSNVVDVNLGAVARGCRTAIAEFVSAESGGSVVNISSIHGRGAFPGSPAYDASKGGVEALTRYSAVEYGHLTIRVNAVAPGAVATSMLRGVIEADIDPLSAERSYANLHPAGRLASPHEVAGVVAFLLSDDASFVNGAVIPVDGGAAARVYAYPSHPDVPSSLPDPHQQQDAPGEQA